MIVFDRHALRLRRERAAPGFKDHDFLFASCAALMGERLLDIRKTFPLVLDLGCHQGGLGRVLQGQNGIETVISCDLSLKMVKTVPGLRLVADEEFLPFAPHSFDAVFSNLSLHWVNDLPGALLQIKQCLKPDGLFLASLLGGETLRELRLCLMEAEMQLTGGASPRVSPFADMADMGALLQRAGFALPVVDSEKITVAYKNIFTLFKDLRGMGETSVIEKRLKKIPPKALFLEAACLYQEKFSGSNIDATFEIIHIIGWSPHESQQQPLKPGTAKARLADVLGAEERVLPEKARP